MCLGEGGWFVVWDAGGGGGGRRGMDLSVSMGEWREGKRVGREGR